MTSPNVAQRRSGAFLIGSLVALASFASLAATPAEAQIDIGNYPVAGTWTRGVHDTVAWVDLATWKVVTSTTGAPFSARYEPQPQPWFPVAGDWDGDGVDSVQMFNVNTWRAVPAEEGPLTSTEDPSPNPWVPVAGDWEGRGYDTIRVFDRRDASLHRLEEGPIRFERYDPSPNPWMPVAGDWDGHRIDTLATFQRQEPRGDEKDTWVFLAGDWDGDGIDTDAALHLPSGQITTTAEVETATLRSATGSQASPAGGQSGLDSIFARNGGGSGACYKTVTNWNQWVKVFHYGGGGCMVIVNTTWLEWTCCLTSQNGGDYGCSSQLKMKVKTYGYSNC